MFSDPEQNIKQLELKGNMHVADLGAGSGFYTFAVAKVLNDGGKVYAVEVQKELMLKIKAEAIHRHLSNIEVLWGDIEVLGGTKLGDASTDVVIASNVLFQVEDKKSFISEIRRILNPSGRVLLIDWSDSFGGMGPTAEAVVSEASAREMFERSGFVFDKKIDAGAHHYGIILKKI